MDSSTPIAFFIVIVAALSIFGAAVYFIDWRSRTRISKVLDALAALREEMSEQRSAKTRSIAVDFGPTVSLDGRAEEMVVRLDPDIVARIDAMSAHLKMEDPNLVQRLVETGLLRLEPSERSSGEHPVYCDSPPAESLSFVDLVGSEDMTPKGAVERTSTTPVPPSPRKPSGS